MLPVGAYGRKLFVVDLDVQVSAHRSGNILLGKVLLNDKA
jgi:hypothetical protein